MRNYLGKRSLALGIALVVSGNAAAYVVDGYIDDWGVVGTGSASDWTPNAGVHWAGGSNPDPNFPSAGPEDTTGTGRVWPGYGGQQYDAEAIYVDLVGNTLNFAVVTGLPSYGTRMVGDNGNGLWRPGDFAFDFGSDGTYEYGFETTGTGDAFVAGALYEVSVWDATPYAAHNISNPTSIKTGSQVAVGELVYSSAFQGLGAYAGDDHYVIEGSVDIAGFGSDWGQPYSLHWTMDCGNDSINVDVPEPGPLTLIGLGLFGIGVIRRRQRRA